MDLEIVSCKIEPTMRHLGEVVIKYGLINIHCGLTVFVDKTNLDKCHLWIRMPEYWIGSQKFPIVNWINRGISDLFQKVALEKIETKYGINLEKGLEIYKNYCKKRKKSRKS